MTESSNAVPFEMSEESEDSVALDNTCPDCGTESIVSYIDRHSTYEYCTGCDWTEADGDELSVRQLITRRDRWAEEA